jgi:hypothetical protein
MSDDQLPTLEAITRWLAMCDRDRDWLASELGVSKATVNGWFMAGNKRPIPGPTHRLLAVLMQNTELGEPRFTHGEHARIQKAMKAADYHEFPDFARDAVNAFTDQILAKERALPLPHPPRRITYPSAADERHRHSLNEEPSPPSLQRKAK